jgi:rubrerythrin
MSRTSQNLAAAFAGESQANRKYLYFAKKADEEGQTQVARLFRAAAEAETVHALNHLGVMGIAGDTAANLGMAIQGEHDEFTDMYPSFIEAAQEENQPQAEMSFMRANSVEQIHHDLFTEALEAVKAGKKLEDKPYYICPVCGNTVLGEPDFSNCPICGVPGSKFMKID